MPIELIDTHAHLQAKEFDSDRAEVFARARAAGVTRMIVVGAGDGWNSTEKAIALVKGSNYLWASAGIHPNSAQTPLDKLRLKNLALESRVVALGETGLDYYWTTDYKEAQIDWFKTHIEVAREVNKPLIIHTRGAGASADCLKLVKEYKAREVGGVFHCYAENSAFAQELSEHNFLVSFPGIVTFKNAEEMRTAVREIPISQIMLETDSPYLAPVPYRGKRCESAFMVETAKTIAQIKGMTLDELAARTNENAIKLFKL